MSDTKTILITGSTSGFGKGLVKPLLQKGYRVIATGRRLTQRTEIFTQERQLYPDRLIEKDFDVTSASEREALLQYIKAHYSLDIIINNAGYGLFGPLEGAEEEQLRHQFEVNVFGPVFLIRDSLPLLRQSKGLVINLASVLGFVGFPLASAYCSTKFAVEGLTESLAYELAPHGVRFALIEPGAFGTNFNNGTQWTKDSESPHSPYHIQVSNYQRLRDSMMASPNMPNPAVVVEKILGVIEGTESSFRCSVGKDARFTRLAQALLPKEFFHCLARWFYSKILMKKI